MKLCSSRATPTIAATVERVDYVVVTAKGAPIKTFEDRDVAVDWLTKPDDSTGFVPLDRYPGAEVRERVTFATAERTVWRKRVLKVVGS